MTEWEQKQLDAEIKKIDLECKKRSADRIRKNIGAYAVVIGVLISVGSLWLTLAEVRDNATAQAEEARVRAHQLFTGEILDRIAGRTGYTIEYEYRPDGKDGKWVDKSQTDTRWGRTSQLGALYSATQLAKEIPHLCKTVVLTLEDQAAPNRGLTDEAAEMLATLKEFDHCQD